MKAIAALLICATLTACGDCPPDAVIGSADTAIAAPSPAPVQTPVPAPVAKPTPTPQPEPITYCPQSTSVVCAPSPTPARPEPEPTPEPDYSYNDCRCDSQGVMTCSAPNPPAYVFCPAVPRPNPSACHYECNNESGPVTF